MVPGRLERKSVSPKHGSGDPQLGRQVTSQTWPAVSDRHLRSMKQMTALWDALVHRRFAG